MRWIILFIAFPFYGQVLHHQMISAQGKSVVLPNKIILSQSIGQQSVVGTTTSGITIQQGFQQNYWSKLIAKETLPQELKITTYPNPFVTLVNFQFSKPINGQISVFVFDIRGRLIIEKQENGSNSILTLDLSPLPSAEYLVRLSATNLNYYTKILKSL